MSAVWPASDRVVIEFAVSYFCSKNNIRRYDCSRLWSVLTHILFCLSCVKCVMFVRLVYIFCRPDDQYLSCVLIDYYFVLIRYLYYDFSIFLTWKYIIGVPNRPVCFLFKKKNIRNNFVRYCTWIHQMFLASYDYNIEMCAYHYILFNWVSKYINSFFRLLFRTGTKRHN